jgi:nucleoside-diphosphate-sugar epimerase
MALAERGVRSSVVRLPRSVHGEGDRGFISMLIAMAREKGVSGYVGDGSNRWPAVHVLDAADLFCLAFERAAPGAVLHAVGDEGVATREIANVIGRRLNVPVASMPPDQLGFLGMVMAHDQPASSAQTQASLGWRPVHPGLITDMEAGHYFAAASAAHAI